MKKTSKTFVFFFSLICVHTTLFAQKRELLVHRAHQAITNVIVHDIFSPPVASRIYLYANIAAHESMVASGKSQSFHALRNDFIQPSPVGFEGRVHPEASAVYAMMLTASKLVFSEARLIDSLAAIAAGFNEVDPARLAASMEWATLVSNAVVLWSKTDRYADTRKMRRYSLIKDKSAWSPTPPGYFAPVEPHWGKMRTVVLDTLSKFQPKRPIPFSDSAGSPFYRQADQVFRHTKTMPKEDSAIALFWDCNPFHLTVQGHLNFATKKLSPGGHWMSIAGIASRQSNASLEKSLQAYLFTSIALYDAFISCWDEKYRSNVIRPETYINAYLDQGWRPLLQTPPFPEYTSGHSVVSSASSTILTALIKQPYAFTDSSEMYLDMPPRKFKSLREASNEASMSRFYGGIHFMPSLTNGVIQGNEVGNFILGRFKKAIK